VRRIALKGVIWCVEDIKDKGKKIVQALSNVGSPIAPAFLEEMELENDNLLQNGTIF
jgi:hypothetical protein